MASKFFNNPNQAKLTKTDKKGKVAPPKPAKSNTNIRKTGRGNQYVNNYVYMCYDKHDEKPKIGIYIHEIQKYNPKHTGGHKGFKLQK